MKPVLKLFAGLMMLVTAVASAEVRIVIDQGVDTARPIAVVPFKWTGSGNPPDNVAEIVAADLRNSGKFNPIPPARMPQQPSSTSEVNPALWSVMGIDAIVVGQVQAGADGNYLISYQLVDTAGSPGTVLETNQYRVTKQWIRYAAHTISDMVFERLTGIKGAFRTRIAYVVQTNGGRYPYELRVSDYDGFNQFVVHRSPEPIMSPAWTKDGRKLAYVTFENRRSQLMMQDLSTSQRKVLTSFPRHNGAPSFSPDGTKMAFALSKDGSLKLYVMDLASGQIRRVTEGRFNDTEPSWYPDSQSIAFTSDRGGRPQIYKLNLASGAVERLTWEGAQNQNGEISPDGKALYMVSSAGSGQHIAKQDLDTGSVEVLTNTFLDETPSVSPNGIMLIYGSTQGLGRVLNLVSTDGRFKARVPATDGQVKFPAWSPYL